MTVADAVERPSIHPTREMPMAATTSPPVTEDVTVVTPDDRPAPTARKKRRRGLAWLLLLPALALAGFGTWRVTSKSEAPAATTPTQTKQVVAASTGSMSNTVSAQGTIAAEQTDELNFDVSGEVTAVNVVAGDKVTAGQVLATIDSAELASALATAQSNLSDAQATLSNDYSAGASYTQITADQAKVTTATDAVATAEANLEAASLIATFDGTVSSVNLTVGEQLGSGGTGSTSSTGSASGSGQSSSPLGSSSNSPTGNNRATTGSTSATTTTSTAQVVVVSAGKYKVTLQVSSADVGQVSAGQNVSLTTTSSTSSSNAGGFPGGGAFPGGGGAFPGGGAIPGGGGVGGGGQGNGNAANGQGGGRTGRSGATASGTVTEVGKVASASSGVATYPVTVTFAADPAQFFVGGSVTAQITTTKIDNVVQVPSQAVTTDADGSSVQLSTDGTADHTETRTVTTGITASGMVQITAGLNAGDKVVVTQFRPPGLTGGGQAPTQNPAGGAGQRPAGAPTGAPTGAPGS